MRSFHILGPVLIGLVLTGPAHAGMKKDISDCIAADRKASARACTRVMNSGRLPRSQFYIGYFNRGSAYRHAGKPEKALSDFNRVVKLRPKFPRAYFSRALTQHDLGALDKAAADLSRYIELEPKGWSGYYNRALVYRKQDKTDLALADLDEAAKLKPDTHDIPIVRALILSDEGKHADARQSLSTLISAQPKDAAAYYARAIVAYREQQLDTASGDLDKALSIEKSFAAAHTLKGRIMEARGRVADAKSEYRRAVKAKAKLFDDQPAKQLAKDRLSKLTGKSASNVALKSKGADPGCRRFLPTTGVTIPYDCAKQ